MPQIHSIEVNGIVYELPSANQFSSDLQDLGRAMQSSGMTAQEMINTLQRISTALFDLERHTDELATIRYDLNNLQSETKTVQNCLDSRTAVLDMQTSELHANMGAEIEILNQKIDLEISSLKPSKKEKPIIDTKDLDDWYDNFMKELEYE